MDKLDFSAISKETASVLQSNYDSKKKGKSVSTTKPETVQAAAHRIATEPQPSIAAPQRKYSGKEQGVIANALNRAVGAVDNAEEERRKLAKLKARKIRQIQDYKGRDVFGGKFDHIKVPPHSAPLETIEVVLEEIHEICASEGAEQLIRQLPVLGAYSAEYMAKIGYLNMHLNGFGETVARSNPAELEPALTETVIELKPYVSSPHYMRLVAAMVGMATQYHHNMTPAVSRTVQADTVKSTQDL